MELSAYEALARSLQLREKTQFPSSSSSSSNSDRPRRRSSTLSHGDELACIDSMEMDEFFEFLQGSGEDHHHAEFLLADMPLASHPDPVDTAAPEIEPTSPRGKPKKSKYGALLLQSWRHDDILDVFLFLLSGAIDRHSAPRERQGKARQPHFASCEGEDRTRHALVGGGQQRPHLPQ